MVKYFFIFLMLLTSIFAEGQIDTTTVYSIHEVVITTQRKPKESTTVPYSISYLSRKSLDSFMPRTTPEALISMNGLFVQKTNHGGGSPFIRGLTGNQTLLLVDGIRLNNSIYRYGPNQYLNTIDVFAIEQIEAAKGTGSVQYGTDAIGGALQVFTKSPELNQEKSTFKGSVFGKYMTGDMEKTGHSELEFSSKRYAVLIGGTYHNFGDIIGGKNTGKQSPSGYNEYAFNAKIIASPAENIQFTFANQFNIQQHVPLYHKVVLENYLLNKFDPQQRMLSYARLNVRRQGQFFNQFSVIASWQQNMEGRISQKNGSSLITREKDQVNTLGLTFDFDSKFSSVWIANSGIEIYHDQVGSSRTEINTAENGLAVNKRGLYPDNSQYGNYSIFTLHHFDFGKWIFDGGIRFNSFDIKITDNNLGKVKISPEALVFNSALMYNISRHHHIYSTFSSGFRAPNIDDLGTLGIVDFRYEVPAYDLKPEKSQNYELGYKLSLPKLTGTVAAYYMNLNQLITRTKEEGRFIDGYQVYKKENVEEAYISGFETSLNWKALARLEINGGISYTYGQNMTKDEPMRRIPPFNGRLASTYKFSRIFYSAEFLFASKQDRLAQGDMSDNRISQGGTPGWQIVNLYAGYFANSIKLNIGLQNIFNEDYRTHGSGINNVGRSAFLSAGFSF